jgi:hypothetical protein
VIKSINLSFQSRQRIVTILNIITKFSDCASVEYLEAGTWRGKYTSSGNIF